MEKIKLHCAISFHLYYLCMFFMFLFISSDWSTSLFFSVLSLLHAAVVIPFLMMSSFLSLLADIRRKNFKKCYTILPHNYHFCYNVDTHFYYLSSE